MPSSGNSGECDPWRYTTDPFANESIELLTGAQSHWFHPRLRFFAGREESFRRPEHLLLSLRLGVSCCTRAMPNLREIRSALSRRIATRSGLPPFRP